MLALLIFVVTLIFIIWRPKGLGIGWSALAGSGMALMTGVIHWQDIPVVWHIVWDATFTIQDLTGPSFESVEMDLPIFQRSLQTLDEYVVHPPAASVHAGADRVFFQHLREPECGGLRVYCV